MVEIEYLSSRKMEFKKDDLVCYCFGYTRKDIEGDYLGNGYQSKILEKIISEKKREKCNCSVKNPKGR